MKNYKVYINKKIVGSVRAFSWREALDKAVRQYGNCWIDETLVCDC